MKHDASGEHGKEGWPGSTKRRVSGGKQLSRQGLVLSDWHRQGGGWLSPPAAYRSCHHDLHRTLYEALWVGTLDGHAEEEPDRVNYYIFRGSFFFFMPAPGGLLCYRSSVLSGGRKAQTFYLF